MTLLVLTYHRAHAGADGNSTEMLDAHFECIASRYVNVLPGDALPDNGQSVCLCFDGAFFDFYATVFPLLQKHKLRAVLAVAPSVVRDHTTTSERDRIEMPSEAAYAHPAAAGFCTWCELEELVRSGAVAVAAHGYSHRPLEEPAADLETEIHVPRTLLGTRLATRVESFVFPYGKFSRRAVVEARSAYRFVFADGRASNASWNTRILNRVPADNLRTPDDPFDGTRLAWWRARAMWRSLSTV